MNNDLILKRFAKIIIGLQIVIIVSLIFFPKASIALAEATFEMFFFAEDAAHTTGDQGYLALGVRNDNATGTPRTSADGEYGYLAINKWGHVYTAPMVSTTSQTISGINIAFDTAFESATSTYFDFSGYKDCTFGFKLTSGGSGTHIIQFIPRKLQPDGSFIDYQDGYWGNAVFEDTLNAVTKGYSLTFPCNKANYIHATTTNTSGSLTFTPSSTYIYAETP